MPILRETLVYDGPGGPFEGLLAYDSEVKASRPGVLVIPNVRGQKESDNRTAERLAALGYVGFACDVFGRGKRTSLDSENIAKYMDELNADRALLRDRLDASLAVLAAREEVDSGRLAAIGFCFGGKGVLDMARAGLPIAGGVSFHGVFDRPDFTTVQPIQAKLLICHGWEDPIAPPSAVEALARELTEAGADWQLHAYGHAGHAFTDLELKGKSFRPGFGYEERADRGSWKAMSDFLNELFR